jgi:hypothetical protein
MRVANPGWYNYLRSEAKPNRSQKVEVELTFDFCDGKKPQVYPRLALSHKFYYS